MKRRILTLIAVLALAGGAVGLYLFIDRLGGSGSWPVVTPTTIRLMDIEGRGITVIGDYPMDQARMSEFTEWLESNGFRRDPNEGTAEEPVVYRGEYKGSLPISITIKSIENPEAAEIFLSFKGSDRKRRFKERQKLVKIFSNKVVVECTDKVPDLGLDLAPES